MSCKCACVCHSTQEIMVQRSVMRQRLYILTECFSVTRVVFGSFIYYTEIFNRPINGVFSLSGREKQYLHLNFCSSPTTEHCKVIDY